MALLNRASISLKPLLSGAVLVASVFLTGCIADAGSAFSEAEEKPEENTLAVALTERQWWPRCPQWAIDASNNNARYWDGKRREAAGKMRAAAYNSSEYWYWKGQFDNAHYSLQYWMTWGQRNRCNMY